MTGWRTKAFLGLLSAYLLLVGIGNVISMMGKADAAGGFWVLYGVSAILAGLSILLKGTPLNFGFIALALFLLLDGINVERIVLDSSYPLYNFLLSSIPAVAAALYFLLHQETRKNIGLLLLSGYLLTYTVISVVVLDTTASPALLVVSALFSVSAAIFLFLRK